MSQALPKIGVVPIFGGRNNRAYQVSLNEQIFFVKHYNKKAETHRSRLQAEYDFLSYAMACQARHVVQPIYCNEALSLGVYEYIKGEKFKVGEIGEAEVLEAVAFIEELSRERSSAAALKLSAASEACFSIAEHVGRIEERMLRLETIQPEDTVDAEAILFVKKELQPSWQKIKALVLRENKAELLSQQNRVISPSDFGFHNALRVEGGGVKFVDFEYSGWDDPAKLVGDFFNQIEVPVPLEYFDVFCTKISELVADANSMVRRAKLLFPLYQVKWCCIVLNYFLPLGRVSKDFVAKVTAEDRLAQLVKAQEILKKEKP